MYDSLSLFAPKFFAPCLIVVFVILPKLIYFRTSIQTYFVMLLGCIWIHVEYWKMKLDGAGYTVYQRSFTGLANQVSLKSGNAPFILSVSSGFSSA